MAWNLNIFGYEILILFTCYQYVANEDISIKQQQLFQGTNLSLNFVSPYKQVFKVLRQEERCSYANLTTCHIEDDLHAAYFDNCFGDVCKIDNYYCLNNPYTGGTLHLCGKATPLNKRQRHIAIIDSVGANTVNVHTLLCPLGFIHLNTDNSFDRCIKDESIVIVQETSDLVGVIARCNIEKNYCNSEGAITFELGSVEDSCFDAKNDLKLQCKDTEELMPDCKCTLKCEDETRRAWFKRKYICENDTKSSSGIEAVHDDMGETTEISKTQYDQKITVSSPAQNINSKKEKDVRKDKAYTIDVVEEIKEDIDGRVKEFNDKEVGDNFREKIYISKLHANNLTIGKHDSSNNTWIWIIVSVAGLAGIACLFIKVVAIIKKRKGCRSDERPENDELLSERYKGDVCQSKGRRVKTINETNTTAVNKHYYNVNTETAYVNIHEDKQSAVRGETPEQIVSTVVPAIEI